MSSIVSNSDLGTFPVLDVTRLEVLRGVEGDDGRPFICEFVELFESDARKRIQELRDVVAKGESGNLRKMAHTLKGSCRNLGATMMAESCLQLENGGDSCTTVEAAEMVERIDAAFAQVLVEVEKLVETE